MKTIPFILLLFILASCSDNQSELCKGKILDLEMTLSEESIRNLADYHKSSDFEIIMDTTQLLKYEEPNRISFFFKQSDNDPKRRKYVYKVKEGIISVPNYQWDLLALIDTDLEDENVKYWLKSYNNDRKQIGHLDFAHWSGNNQLPSLSGRIDCDSSLHMIINKGNSITDRVFKTDETGMNILVETVEKEK